MTFTVSERHPCMASILTEYAVHDASLLVGDMVRDALLNIYSGKSNATQPEPLQRALALRLVERSGVLGHHFTALMTESLRAGRAHAPSQQARNTEPPSAVQLIDRIQRFCAVQLEQLHMALAVEDAHIVAALQPSTYVSNLNRAMMAHGFSEPERNLMFKSWAGTAFAETMQRAYDRYLLVATEWRDGEFRPTEDFAATWPMSL